ncbi:threonine/serine exporter family protein [Mycobacterium sp.]|uniref:threonine/serine exporter family protein n=1 Tax=Mycobacterium sp. TaxID=1785 RepID=UPI002D74D873|nr:threonine/serine exporter family protein [Mycobacterium sp.]HZA11500.1 threonine/serine exporter family protein [Mycobacterium sp.]
MAEPPPGNAAVEADALDTVMKAAVLLQESGQSTNMTLIAVDRLNTGLGIRSTLIPSWSSLLLTSSRADVPVRVASVSPVGVNMRRVASAMRVIDRAEDGRLDRDVVDREIDAARVLGTSSATVFTAACATGAGALAVIFGITDPVAVLLVAGSAAIGGLIRRGLGRLGVGTLPQAFLAAMVAGLIGAAAVHLSLGAATGLIALCPGMVLVPGPHILNGGLDLLTLRITLGIARLGYATLILAAIAAGLVLGLKLGGQTLSVTGSSANVAFYVDVLAAGVAAASYPVYFSMPYRMIGWPVAAGMLARAAHWWAMTRWQVDLPAAALVACLVVGILLIPVSHFLRMPFAAIGFAAIVSLVPGVYVFRAVGGILQLQSTTSSEVLAATVSDATVATLVVAGMVVGLIVPMRARDVLVTAAARRRARGVGNGSV